MSHIWQIQHRLFVEQLEAIEVEPTQEQLVRLVSATRVLLFQHQVDQGGYCRICIRSRWWRLPRGTCTIYAGFLSRTEYPLRDTNYMTQIASKRPWRPPHLSSVTSRS